MTIDEAILHAKLKANEQRHYSQFEKVRNSCIKCAEEHEQLAEWLEELKEYKELEEKGLLFLLPCKIGEDIYVLEDVYGIGEFEITEYRIECMRTGDNSILTFDALEHEECLEFTFDSSDIGRTVFFSYAEAEQELKRLECAEDERK